MLTCAICGSDKVVAKVERVILYHETPTGCLTVYPESRWKSCHSCGSDYADAEDMRANKLAYQEELYSRHPWLKK